MRKLSDSSETQIDHYNYTLQENHIIYFALLFLAIYWIQEKQQQRYNYLFFVYYFFNVQFLLACAPEIVYYSSTGVGVHKRKEKGFARLLPGNNQNISQIW